MTDAAQSAFFILVFDLMLQGLWALGLINVPPISISFFFIAGTLTHISLNLIFEQNVTNIMSIIQSTALRLIVRFRVLHERVCFPY
jgi:hypothetical protein